MTSDAPFRVVVAGGGPAAIEAILTLRDLHLDADVALLAPDLTFRYRPLSTVAPFAHGEVRTYALDQLADFGVTIHRDALMRVDVERRVVVTDGRLELPYDALLVAVGSAMRRAVPRAMTFEGPGYVEPMHGLIQDLEGGYTRSVAFVAPAGVTWTLPLYELALQTAERVHAASLDAELTVVSHERRPLEVMGAEASELVARLLHAARVRFVSGGTPPEADRTIALPVPSGANISGLPQTGDGFIPVDDYGRVVGAPHVWAAGDSTDRPIKQGGLATQQAEAAAQSIAAAAGAPVEPHPYRPELRAMLIDGRDAWFLHRPPGEDVHTEISQSALWEPPTKIAGRRLGPYLDELDAATPRANRYERRIARVRS